MVVTRGLVNAGQIAMKQEQHAGHQERVWDTARLKEACWTSLLIEQYSVLQQERSQ